MRGRLIACAATVLTVATAGTAAAEPVLVLAGGQQAGVAGSAVTVRFERVLEDSRCPALVDCVWAGQARIALVVESAGTPPQTIELSTYPASETTGPTAQVGGHSVALRALDPYPRSPQDAIALQDYRATVAIDV
ncbi:hypothetical protein [Mycobacterium kyogaense]|uniref:hypothetical protein n=1 Tax=Mycobacterium kyogaense TaxID=2212479 RepID=UPI000DACF6B6|nr:hypothetical protein [Mycobacterium kyogaense]